MDALPTGSTRINTLQSTNASSGLQPVAPLAPVERQGEQDPQLSREQNARAVSQPAAEVLVSEKAREQLQFAESSAGGAAPPELKGGDAASASSVPSAIGTEADDRMLERMGRDASQSGRAVYVELGGEARQLAQAAQRPLDVGRSATQEVKVTERNAETGPVDSGKSSPGTVSNDFGVTRDAGTPEP